MIHQKLGKTMTPIERLANMASASFKQGRTAETKPSGSISINNADGTRTIIGAVNKTGSSFATHVGDTTPPPEPQGITVSSEAGTITAHWDGTLKDTIPSDFDNVAIYADGNLMGRLSREGSVTIAGTAGKTVTITATAEDDACLPDGTPSHNVTRKIEIAKITVKDLAAETNNYFFADADGAHVSTVLGDAATGSNALINSEGFYIREGISQIAKMEKNGASFASERARLLYDTAGAQLMVATIPGAGISVEGNGILNTTSVVNLSDAAMLVSSNTYQGENKQAMLRVQPNKISIDMNQGAVEGQFTRVTADIDMNAVTRLSKLLKETDWTYLYNNAEYGAVRWRLKSGCVWLDIQVKEVSGEWAVSNTLPKEYAPNEARYYPLAVSQENNAASAYVDADGNIWLYNNSGSISFINGLLSWPIK